MELNNNKINWRELGLLLLVAFVVLAAGIGLRDPWPADEPRFTLVAKQMIESGNWLIPHRGSELYSDKPPLFMALQAAAYTLTHVWRVAFLLPSLLAGLGMIVLVYDLARRVFDHRTGLWAAGALLCAFQFVYQVKRAQIDPTVSFFVTLANYGLLRHFLLGPNWRAYWLGMFAAGLGVITKGVGVLALLMFAPYLFALWRGWNGVARNPDRFGVRWLGGALAFAAAAALWLGPMFWYVHAQGSSEYLAYRDDILFHQTAGRYTESWDHHQPPWYYLGVIATSWLPLTLALPWLVPEWRRRLLARDARFLLPLSWIVIIVIFFTFPKGKRDVYIMPALPWLGFCAGPFLASIVRRPAFRALAFALIVALGVTALGVGVYALATHPPFAVKLAQQRGLANGGAALWYVAIGLGLVALAAALAFRPRRGVHALVAGLAGVWLVWSFGAYPVLNDSSSAAGVMRRAGEIIGPDAELALVAWKEQNLLHADRPVRDFGFQTHWPQQLAAGMAWLREAPQRRWLFVNEEALGDCVDKARSIYVGHANRREWWLVRTAALVPGCEPLAVPAPVEDDPNAPD